MDGATMEHDLLISFLILSIKALALATDLHAQTEFEMCCPPKGPSLGWSAHRLP